MYKWFINIIRFTKLVFLWTIFFVGIWMLVFDSGWNELSIFLRSNDVDLDVLHDEIKLNNEVANFWLRVLERCKSLPQNNWGLSFPFACNQSSLSLKNICYKEQALPSSIWTSLTIWRKYDYVWLLGERPVTIMCILGNLDWIIKYTHRIPLAMSVGLFNLMLLVPQCITTYFM